MSSTDATPGPTDANAAVGGVEPQGEVDGLEWYPDAGGLKYRFWHKQVEVLSHLNPTPDRRKELIRLYEYETEKATGEAVEFTDDMPADGWDIVGALGGYRSGKTTLGARWIINQASARPGTRWLVMGQDFAKAKKTTFKVLYQNLPGENTHILTSRYNGVESSPLVEDFNRQDQIVTLTNDSQIVLGSADDPGRHAGDEFSGCHLDEPSLYGEDLHQIRRMVGSRLSAGPPACQLWTYTGNGYNAAYDIMRRRVDEEEDPLNANIKEIQLSNQANPFISAATKRKLRRQYEGTHLEEQGLFGGYAAARGLVYQEFRRPDHVIPEQEAWEILDESDEFRLYAYDSGWDDPRVILEMGRTPYGQLVVVDEYYQSETHVEHAIKWLQGHLPDTEESPPGIMWAEHEPSDIRKFRKAGYQAYNADKSHDLGIPAVRRRLGTDARGKVGLLVSDRCENLISEFQTYKEEEVGTAKAEDHSLDSLRYGVAGYDEKTTESESGSSVDKA